MTILHAALEAVPGVVRKATLHVVLNTSVRAVLKSDLHVVLMTMLYVGSLAVLNTVSTFGGPPGLNRADMLCERQSSIGHERKLLWSPLRRCHTSSACLARSL